MLDENLFRILVDPLLELAFVLSQEILIKVSSDSISKGIIFRNKRSTTLIAATLYELLLLETMGGLPMVIYYLRDSLLFVFIDLIAEVLAH